MHKEKLSRDNNKQAKAPTKKQLYAKIKSLESKITADPTLDDLAAVIAESKASNPPSQKISNPNERKNPNVVAALTLQRILKRKRDVDDE